MLKPLVGVANDGPGDASVITPVLGSWRGLAIGCGINPNLRRSRSLPDGRCHAIDEAVRNVVAVGADPGASRFSTISAGNSDRPEVLGSLVAPPKACRDVALAYMMPFISGKDSLNNDIQRRRIIIPPTLLISAMGQVPDVWRCVSMDLKGSGNELFLIGVTPEDMGGSHFNLVHELQGGEVPHVNVTTARGTYGRLHDAMQRRLIRSCHDLSEGGLAVAVAEMVIAGEVVPSSTICPGSGRNTRTPFGCSVNRRCDSSLKSNRVMWRSFKQHLATRPWSESARPRKKLD